MNTILVVLLVLAGVALLLVELFLIPGFGIAGISGFVSLIAAVVLAYMYLGTTAGYITLAACVILSILAVCGFMKSKALDKMALDTKIEGKVTLADNRLKQSAQSEQKDESQEEKEA